MRIRRRVVLVLAAGAGIALVLGLIGIYPHEPVRRAVEARLRITLGPGASVRGVHVAPGALRAEVSGLVLDTTSFRLEIPRLELGLRASTFSGAGLQLRSLVAHGPILRIKAPDPKAPLTQPPRIPPLSIAGLDVRDATVIVELGGGNGILESRGLKASGSVGAATLLIEAPATTWTREKAVELGVLTARIATDSALRARLEDLRLSKGQSHLAASGDLGTPSAFRPNVRFEGDARVADLAELLALVGVSNARGEASFEGTLSKALDDVALSLEARGRNVGVADVDAQSFDLNAVHKGGTSTVALAADVFGGRVAATGSLTDGRTEGRATLADVIFQRLPVSAQVPPNLRGRVSGDVSWNGRLDGRVKIASHLRSQASYGQPLTADVAIEGSVEPRRRLVDLRFRSSADTPGNAWLKSGSLRAEGTARGPWPPAVESSATIAASALLGALPHALQAQLRLSAAGSGSSVRIDGTFLGGTFEGAGRVVGSRLADVRLSASNLELQRIDSRLRGTGKLQLTASGASANPTLDARLDLASVGYEQLALGDAVINVQGTATASRWTLSAPALRVAGDGDLTTGKAGALTGRLTADRAPLASLGSLLPELQGLEGIVTAEAQLRVPLDAPSAAEVGARVGALEARTPRFGPLKTEPFTIGFSAGRVELRDLRAEAPGARARIDAVFGGSEAAPVSGNVRLDVDLAEIEPRLDGVSGKIGVDIEVGGVVNRPRATGSLSLKDLVLELPDRPRVRVADGAIRIQDNVAVVEDLKAELDGGAIVVTGRAPVPAFVPSWRRDAKRVASEEAADITLRWDGFDPGALLARLRPASESRLSGRLTGSLLVRGGLASLDEVDALLTSQAAEVAVGELTARLQPFDVRVAGSRATTDGIQVDATGGTFRLSGALGLADGQLDVTGRGKLDLRVLSPLLSDVALTGTADVDARLSGTTSAPDARGSLTLSDATARFRVLPQAVTDIQASVVFDRNQARLERASALLGGGKLTATGTVALAQASLGTADVAIEGRNLALRYPEGLRSRLDADLKLSGEPGAFRLGGEVRVERALYDRDFQTSGFLTAVTVRDSPLLRSVALDLDVVTRAPLRVRNDTARLEATGQLKVRGDMLSPSPLGRFEVVTPGGELTLLGARYAIDHGTISYDGTWDPQIDVEIRRRIRVRQNAQDVSTIPGEYTATIAARGTVSEITREVLQFALGGRVDEGSETLRFSAEGPGDLDPNDVGSLALVGRRRSEIQGGRVAGEQAGTLIASQLTRKVEKGLPFESITIQPELVSRETAQPDARFTFGAALLDGVDLTYSLSLTRPEDKLIQLEGRTTHNFTAIAKREYDLEERTDILTVGGGQRFELGGGPERRRAHNRRDESVELTEVKLQGLDDPALAKLATGAIRAQAGKKTTVWRVQDDGDRIRESLLKRGYMDVEVGADLEGTLARFDVRAGRAYVTRVSGLADPPDLSGVLLKSLYEEEALDKGRAELLEALFDKGHWRASVTATATDEGETRVLHFAAVPGPLLKLGSVTFPGAVALGQEKLLSAAGGPGALVRAPQEARAAIRKEYEAIHYLEARVLPPRVSEQGGVLEIEVAVEEGPRSLVSEVAFQGQSRPEAELRALSRLQPGMPWDEERALLSVDAIRNDYYRNGWANARVHASHEDRTGGISLTYHVSEGRRLSVGRIEITGLRGVRESFVRGNVDLKPGEPVDPARLGRIERRLLALTVFSSVSSRWSDEDPSQVTFEVQERARFGVGYDVRYSDVEKLAGVLDGEVRNVFGRGLGFGARYQGSQRVDKLRGTFFLPSFPWRGDLQASVFREREEDFGEGETDVTRLQRGFQLQESIQLSSRNSLLLGYRFARTTISSPLLPFPSEQRVASLALSGIRDTRDDVLDAKTGRFVALNLTLAPSWIGSDQDFVKGLAQVFWSVPVGKRMTWAQGYRLGLAHVFNGEPLISTEGFRAGGSSTIRGFPSDALAGGLFGAQALVVLNQELRFRSASGFGGAVFYDAGQVFPTVRDIDFNWRHAVGAGLRWASPFGLLRLDVGFPLARKEGEKGFRVFVSLGQAF